MDAFGISVNQASTDLNRYLGMIPDNMVPDKRARTYVRGSRFEQLRLKLDAARYLSHLRAVVQAIRNTQAIEVEYQSLSGSAAHWRWITPHVIAFDGLRWLSHGRYRFTDHCFKDCLPAPRPGYHPAARKPADQRSWF